MSVRTVLLLVLSMVTWSQPSAAASVAVAGATKVPKATSNEDCSSGCELCSDTNGCLQCKPSFYLILVRDYMTHKGVCVESCPLGFYPIDNDRADIHYKRCMRCKIKNCDVCHSRLYCNQCRPPYVEYRGSCREVCPLGLHYANYTKECLPKVDCVVGMWSAWSECEEGDKSCQVKYGMRTRSRPVLQLPSENGAECPSNNAEQRLCDLPRRHCPGVGVTAGLQPQSDVERMTNEDTTDYKRPKRKRNRKQKPLKACNTQIDSSSTNGTVVVTSACHSLRHGRQSLTTSDNALVTGMTLEGAKHFSDEPTSTLVPRMTTASSPRHKSIDVFSSDYYNYYLTLAVQLLKEKPRPT